MQRPEASTPPAEAGTRARSKLGYSIIELIIAAAIATSGLYASLALCMSALEGNSKARDSAMAQNLAEHVIATIQGEAAFFWLSNPPEKANQTRFIKHVIQTANPVVGDSSGWRLVPGRELHADKRTGDLGGDTTHYDLGMILELRPEHAPRYCAHWRLTVLNPSLLRAEVRVAWPNRGVPSDKYKACPSTMAEDIGNVGSVTLPAMVMRNGSVL